MKKMIFALLITIGLLSACDVDRFPYSSYTEEQIKADKEAAVAVLLNGCYAQLKSWSDVMHRVGEYPGDNIMIRGTSTDDFYPFISYQHAPNNGRLTTFWNNSYKVIVQSSNIMKMISENESETINQQLGEAYYLRGLTYFYLCRVFGRPYAQSPETNLGVPIVYGAPEDFDNLNLPDRSTVKEVYKQVISDLKKAEQLMKKKRTASYASPYSAQAMLSRVYLYMSGTYENPNTLYADSAIYYAQKVIDSGEYTLLSRENFMKYNTFPPDANSQTETIFAIKRVSSEFSGYDHYYGIGGMYANIQGMGWGEMYASAKYLDLLRKAGKKNDARWAFIAPQYQTNTSGQKIEAFRFVADLLDNNGNKTGYKYVQDTLRQMNNGTYYIRLDKQDFPLTLINSEENTYSIQYQGATYIGEKDYLMILNRVYPMFYVLKCSLQDNESHLHSPIISRLAELYLNMAEAYAKKGLYSNALTNLNIIRERSIPGAGYASLNATNAVQRIDEERQLELAFEAHRAYDVYRNGQSMSRHYPGPQNAIDDIPATSLRVVHYIPQSEINAYIGTLTQNP